MIRINFALGDKYSPQFKEQFEYLFINIIGLSFKNKNKTIEQLYFGIDENELNVEEQKLEFYNTNEIYEKEPQSEMNLDFEKNEQFNISMLAADNVVSIYVDEQCAFTTRMYASQGTTWGIFGINSGVQYENVRIYK